MEDKNVEERIYDVIVIGGGPAGYTAALYEVRSGLSVLVLEKLSPGGQMTNTDQIDNYPGFPEGIGGFELGERMQKGALRFGAENQFAEVKSVELSGPVKAEDTKKGIQSPRGHSGYRSLSPQDRHRRRGTAGGTGHSLLRGL